MGDVNIKYKDSTIAELSETGNKTIKTGGTYCENDILVEYTKPEGGGATNFKMFTVEVASKQVNTWLNWVPANADIAAHMNDSTFGFSWSCLSPVTAATSVRCGLYTNAPMGWNATDGSAGVYGMYQRTNATGISAPVKLTNAPTVKPSVAAGAAYVDSDGSMYFYASSTYPTQPGTYQIVVWW